MNIPKMTVSNLQVLFLGLTDLFIYFTHTKLPLGLVQVHVTLSQLTCSESKTEVRCDSSTFFSFEEPISCLAVTELKQKEYVRHQSRFNI